MPVTKIARTHLAYQFIIFIILFAFIGYYELLPERKVLFFLSFVPLVFYHLMILSCCTDLLPLPRWMNPSLHITESSDSKSEELSTDTKSQKHQSGPTEQQTTVKPAETLEAMNSKMQPRVYRFRNWKKDSSMDIKSSIQPHSSFDPSSVTSLEKIREFNFGNTSNQFQKSELTKSYYFPYRQKRLEKWLESDENARPLKISSRQSNLKDFSSPEVTSTQTPDDVRVSNSSPSHEFQFLKSYSFPLRQKRLENYTEVRGKGYENSELTSSLQCWQNDKSDENDYTKLKRSFSNSAVSLEHLNLTEMNDKHKDFSQSMDISNTPDAGFKLTKTPSTTFNKMKEGFTNYFAKIKKDNLKTNSDKQTDYKRRSIKSIFQNKENTYPNIGDRKNSRKSFSPQNNKSSYISYSPFRGTILQ